jgi:putative hydrolase of the HAD superfamily
VTPAAPRAILFDAMGTLVELLPPAPRLRHELAERFGLRVSDEQAAGAIAAEIAFYRTNLDSGRDAASVACLRTSCAEIVRGSLPPSAGLEAISTPALTAALMASIRFEAYADVRPALEAARRRGARLAVVSNWDASLPEVLARLDLTGLLDGVLSSAEVGARKPAPEIFGRALTLCGVTAERAIHVGDAVEEDVMGARAAGIEPILLRRGGGDGPPGVRTIHSLGDLTAGGP